ncbi:energy transducer TonB [Thiothrix winogradskyi]|uniref:Protein TonB n=1 Tax=Thiothrix winogradskyi TaxID=96472 RepID=A0ABY3T1E3_9GAMM|nr:energy transducer TonB [Thiothrix winogradskyi]UJS25633.1 energy transducer TonB [Thiothrix winogradskyi]
MKTALAGFGISALVHAIVGLVVVPLLLWQDKLGLPEAQPTVVPLSLAQFQPAPIVPVVPAPVAKPEPPPKPVEKPKPVTKPQPVEKPKPEKKPVEKKLAAATKPKSDNPPKPETPVVKPVVTPSPSPTPAVATQAVTPVPKAVPVPKPAPVAPSAPAIDNAAAEAAYRQKLQNLIGARKQYPRQAERAEVEGIVTVSFTVLPNGTITGARVSQSSGNEWLDKAALQAVNASSGTLPFPAGINKKQWDFALKVNFRLN